MCDYCEREALTEVQSASVHGRNDFELEDGTKVKVIGTAGWETAVIVREGSEGYGMNPQYAIRYSEQVPFSSLRIPGAEQREATCAGCGERIFRREDETWDLVYKLQDDTTICFIRHGEPDEVAYQDRAPHTPLTASGFAPGTPYFEIYPASGPDAFSTKRNPTCSALGTAEHNARKYSRDGRAYVVESVDGDGKRSKLAEFRDGRKVRQA